VLHKEEDEVDMQSPPSTRDLCVIYLLADGRWSSKFGGEWRRGRNRRRGAAGGDRILPAPFLFSPLRAAAHAISLLVPARAMKDSLLHQLHVRCE
jgi:hypothetical protein